MYIYSRTNPPCGFYVYAYLRVDGTPYYIGKGKDTRAFIQHKKADHTGISTPKDTTKIVIVEHMLSDIGALAIERRLIAWYGRKDLGTGILRNKTDGGDGSAGAVRTDSAKLAIGKASKVGRKRTHTDESKKLVSIQHLGKSVSSETRQKIKNATKGKPKPMVVCRLCDRKEMSAVGFSNWSTKIKRSFDIFVKRDDRTR